MYALVSAAKIMMTVTIKSHNANFFGCIDNGFLASSTILISVAIIYFLPPFQTLSNKYAICTIGRYKNDPNIIFNADLRSPDLISEKVCAKKSTPQTVTTIAELRPVIPKVAGNNPNGIKNIV